VPVTLDLSGRCISFSWCVAKQCRASSGKHFIFVKTIVLRGKACLAWHKAFCTHRLKTVLRPDKSSVTACCEKPKTAREKIPLHLHWALNVKLSCCSSDFAKGKKNKKQKSRGNPTNAEA
jgi:hypothetical protein